MPNHKNPWSEPPDHGIGRSRGGLTTKLHLVCDGRGRPLSMMITAGNINDTTMMSAVLENIRVPRDGKGRPRTRPDRVLADKGYPSRANRAWLRDLKYMRMVTSFSIVHATLDVPQRWGYVFDKLAAAASFTYQNTAVCFFGHTHVPVAFMRDTVVRGGTYSKFKVEPGKKYFVNVGAVGQPRDNNPKAAYVIYDMNEGTIELRRLDYDIATAQKKILAAGLPERLAERLAYGR